MTVELEQKIEIEVPEEAREIGINRITVHQDEVTIYIDDGFIQVPIYEPLGKTYRLLENGCKMLQLSNEAAQWIVVIVQLELEKGASN